MSDAQRLIDTSRELSQARTLDQVQRLVSRAARSLVDADGATFVIRDGSDCVCVHEDAITSLWMGQRFSLTDCLSGWCMLNRAAAVIPDVFADERAPHHLFRDTFVKSLVIVPVRQSNPVATIGVFWERPRQPTAAQVELLQGLADSVSVALERTNVDHRPTASAVRAALATERCRNLYHFIRLRLGQELSDRELARRWGMNWRSFLNLKEGNRRVPRLEELESLAECLNVDPALVTLVARGEPADVVNRWLLDGDTAVRQGLLARLGLSAANSDAPLLHSSIDRIPCGLVTMDLRGCIRDSNARLAEMVSDARPTIGEHFINLVAPESAAAFLKLQTQTLETGEAGPEVVQLHRGDVVDVSMVGVTDSTGRVVGFQGVLQPLPARLTALLDSGI